MGLLVGGDYQRNWGASVVVRDQLEVGLDRALRLLQIGRSLVVLSFPDLDPRFLL